MAPAAHVNFLRWAVDQAAANLKGKSNGGTTIKYGFMGLKSVEVYR